MSDDPQTKFSRKTSEGIRRAISELEDVCALHTEASETRKNLARIIYRLNAIATQKEAERWPEATLDVPNQETVAFELDRQEAKQFLNLVTWAAVQPGFESIDAGSAKLVASISKMWPDLLLEMPHG